MLKYRIKRTPVTVTVKAGTITASTATTDNKVNGLLRGIIITVPSFSVNITLSVSDSISVNESVAKA